MDPSNLPGFLLRAAVLGLAFWGLTLSAWAVVRSQLARASGALRLAALLLTVFAVNATVVVGLGLAGALTTPYYLLVCVSLGGLAWRRRRDLHRTLARLLADQLRLWSRPWYIAAPAALWLLLLCHNSLLVRGIDSLSLHGPWIVTMVQSGRLLLETQYNYPLLWEFQFVPIFLILRSDALAIVPMVLIVLAAMTAILAAARSLGVPGTAARLVAWLCCLSVLIWRGDVLKNDTPFAVSLLVALIAAERVSKGHRGGPFLALLAGFMLIGTKGTGFVYAGLVGGFALGLYLLKSRGGNGVSWRRVAVQVPLALGCLAIPGTMQIANFLRTGNPFHPIAFNPAGIEIFPGPANLRGTSILDHAGAIETWKELLAGVGKVTPELPVAMLAFVLALATSGTTLLRARFAGRRVDGRAASIFVGCCLVAILWLLFLATPWSRGNTPDNFNYLKNGQSLRYATGQLFATYILAAAFLRSLLGLHVFNRLAAWVLPALIVNAWYGRTAFFRTLRSDFLPGLTALVVLGLLALALCRHATFDRALQRIHSARPALLAALALTLAATLRYQVEAQREKVWMPRCRAVWHYARTQIPPGSTIALNGNYPTYRYLLYGAGLSNVLLRPPGKKLISWIEQSDARYIYFKVNRRTEELDQLRLELLKARAWVTTRRCKGIGAQLLERQKPPASRGS